ncbi:MAG: sigma-70 family RNA polymerase sigma factor [Candidatus Sericytochromatia bacterium]|nr:sigma-70 family RNA polymerase sigma factor [Candidatus Sericytochromatia bacterium]
MTTTAGKPAKVKTALTPERKREIVSQFLPLVKKIAKGLARRSTDPVEDLIQVGSIGLLEAAERYQQGYNTEFKTYAIHFITGHIRHYLRDRQSLLKGPRALQELSYRLSQITQKLTQEFDREPTHDEIAGALQIDRDRIREVQAYDRRVTVLWLDQECHDSGEDESRSLLDTVSDPGSMGGNAETMDNRIVLSEAIERLPMPLRELLELRYFHDLTQAELSKRFGISQMEVCRRLKRAEKQLRVMLSGIQLMESVS